MNSNPSTPVAPATNGRRYWRSLDELSDTPEFKEWLHREFPQGASEFDDAVSRRHFVKMMAASFALAGFGLMATGCRRPEEELVPFSKAPEAGYDYGVPQYFATAMPRRTGAIPLVVKSYDGRPIKIEGSALYPGGNGGTDRYAQASILDLYDPDRAKRFTHGGKEVLRDEALQFLEDLSRKFASNQGEGLAFLAESSTSPSRARLQKIIAQKFPKSQWFTYDAVDSGIHQRAATQAFGRAVRPVYQYDSARVILSLDCDFIGTEEEAYDNIRRFAQVRRLKGPGDSMNRLYQIESLYSLTGTNADHRLRVAAGLIGQVAGAILGQINGSASAAPAGVDPKWISECAKDLKANGHHSLVVAGQRQPVEVHLLAHAMNTALGSVGRTVLLIPVSDQSGGSIADLNESIEANKIRDLVILGGNPAYNAPNPGKQEDFNRIGINYKGRTYNLLRLGYYEDETFQESVDNWHFPAAHYLESWGDAIGYAKNQIRETPQQDVLFIPIQPLIRPMFDGMTELEMLARLAGEPETNPYDIVRKTFDDIGWEITPAQVQESWKKCLFNGFLAYSEVSPVDASFDKRSLALPTPSVPSASNLEVVFYRDSKMDDGRYANNGWMQELGDPVTKIVWDNAVLISRKTARELGLQNGDMVEITLNGSSVAGPIWVQPGMADYSLGLAFGYGRDTAGRVGTGVGFNAYKIFSGKYIETGATIRKTGQTHIIACTQDHWSMEGRPAVREADLDEFQKNPDFAQEMHDKEPPLVKPLYPNPLDEAKKTALQQWGLVVDLTACVGCGTCVVACQSENNIPIVGKDQVLRGREMHWMRIDRYYTADPARETREDTMLKGSEQQFEHWIDDVQAVHQPMLCQMCEAAPCENVCPVNATTHDQEGLNVMVYNRCIGTRYCSNNCPYKVRRFNFFDYNKRPLEDLKGPLYPTPLLHKTDGKWDMAAWWKHPNTSGMRADDEWDLIKMVKNPDVTVRSRGVMEKCTYCTQRIQQAEIAQKVKAGPSGDVRLKESEGTIPKTACQQACPAQAIAFGDISDPNSTVSKWKASSRNYAVLGELLTKPRTTYLARVRNPNRAMPDYQPPYSTEEYQKRGGEFHPAEKGNS